MHATPDFRISVRRFGVWRVASAVIGVAATAVACAWVALSIEGTGAWLATAVACVGLAVTLALARPVAAFSLRWDTQAWHLGPESSRGHEPRSGRIQVALDLGSWVLLRFSVDASRRVVWLPVQQRGHEADWQALRRTVHGARPVSAAFSARGTG
jgi:hypothetical protein